MSEQDGAQATAMERPANKDKEGWRAYWGQQGQPWRTEPEVDEERQKYLAERREIKPNIEMGIYPFRDVKLGRADVEWLLAMHEGGRGPVDWNDGSQREREGLDLRGADLRQEDLHNLPLARLQGGLVAEEWRDAADEQRNMAAVFMEGTNLRRAHLERASFRWAHLENADLQWTEMERVNFRSAHLERANLSGAHLEGATLKDAYLVGANLNGARLERAHLDNVTLSDEKHIAPWLADVQWGNATLSTVKWSQVTMLSDEFEARQSYNEKVKDRDRQQYEYEEAVRANRQLAVALQAQGLNEDAARFAYRAQRLQRVVLWRQRKFGSYLFSGFLDVLAGYGYRSRRSVLWYLVIIFGFAIAYFWFGHLPFFPDTFVFSLTSFHGRGFFPGLGSETSLHNPLVVLAAVEAVIGLFIEISFIATFTKRFFGS